MNRTLTTFSVTAALLCFAAIGCTDPTVAPKSSVSSANVFNDPNSYRAFLAKIYGGLIVTGQRGPDGNPDIAGIDEGFGEYLRLYWYLQGMLTDDAPLGATPPKQATRADIYAFVVSELNDIIGNLPPKGPSTYGRATPEAAHMLLAKVYLNAGVYTGTPNYSGALTEAQAVISAGYSLATNFRSNFTADNNTSPELIFVATQDGINTQTWGGMTVLIHAGCGRSTAAGRVA